MTKWGRYLRYISGISSVCLGLSLSGAVAAEDTARITAFAAFEERCLSPFLNGEDFQTDGLDADSAYDFADEWPGGIWTPPGNDWRLLESVSLGACGLEIAASGRMLSNLESIEYGLSDLLERSAYVIVSETSAGISYRSSRSDVPPHEITYGTGYQWSIFVDAQDEQGE